MREPGLLFIGNYLVSPKTNKNVWHHLAERLKNRGWRIITTSDRSFPPFRLLDMVWTIFFHQNQYRLCEIDVFSGRAFFWAEICSFLLKIMNKPMILVLHGGKLPHFACQHPIRVAKVFKRATIIVSPSPYQQTQFVNIRSDIRVIPNPIDLNQFTFSHRIEPKPKLIWVRAFHDIYSPTIVPEVIKGLISKFPDISLCMIGPDKGDGSLQRMLSVSENLGVQDCIKICGRAPHESIPDLLNQSDIFINTSEIDNFPSSVLEAMANGLCIVSTNVGGLPWLIDDEENGLLVPPNDPAAMAQAVGRILTEPDLSNKLSKNARQKAEMFSWPLILSQWEALFWEVINSTNV